MCCTSVLTYEKSRRCNSISINNNDFLYIKLVLIGFIYLFFTLFIVNVYYECTYIPTKTYNVCIIIINT